MNPSATFWDWAFAAYARPGAQTLLLHMQDAHKQSVVYLLWTAWLAALGRGVSSDGLQAGAEAARTWEVDVTGPLRQVRRRSSDPAAATLCSQVLELELAAEKLLMERLEGIAAGAPGPAAESTAEAFAQAVRQWGAAVPPDHIDHLAYVLG